MRRLIPPAVPAVPAALLAALLAALVVTAVVASPFGTTATAAPATADRSPLPATQVVHVRPVTASGRPAPGWTVTHESGTVDCSGSSPSAIDPGIAGCYPTAYSFVACFRSLNRTVLCVRDVRSHELVRIRYTGTYPTRVQAPARPTPATTVLSDGRVCQVRTGGAWGSPAQQPQWVGFSSCSAGASTYGSGTGNGVDQRSRAWTVRLWRTTADPDGRDLVVRRVVRAYDIGLYVA